MKTKQKISTICYNSVDYLKSKLEDLLNAGRIDFYAFVPHKAEEDEKKDHIHLLIFPNGNVNTNDLNEYFYEYVPDSDKPLGTCGIWHIVGKNNLSDWFLYAVHDVVYCRLKGYSDRKYTYTSKDIITSNEDGLDEMFYEAYHTSKFYFDKTVRETVFNSDNPLASAYALVKDGYVPLNQMCSFHHFIQIVKGG